VYTVRVGRRRYAIRLQERHEPRTTADALEALRAVVAGFETLVREYPHQWFQFADFWHLSAAARSARAMAQRQAETNRPDLVLRERHASGGAPARVAPGGRDG
jgi:hypothetical protein